MVCAALMGLSLSATGPWTSASASAGASATRAPSLGTLLLASSDVPGGWKRVEAPTTTVQTRLGCLATLAEPGKAWHHDSALFTNGKGLPFVSESLATGPRVATMWQRVRTALSGCRSATITVDGKPHRASIRPLPSSTEATGSVASRWRFEATGLALGIDLVAFRVHQVLGSVSYVDVGTPDARNAAAFWSAAIAKAEGTGGAVVGVVSVATAPVRVARTSDGRVAYRKVGSGPPLVLVMGYGASMEAWDPQFVDALAHRFTVIEFDNAGIGKTSSPPTRLTIDAMAAQTSALITALHLRAPDVLGWSMGGLVAEALAVRHPGQVHRLVLCATYPGTRAVRPPQSVVDDLNAGGDRAERVLFPPGHAVDAAVVTTAASMYLTTSSTPKKVIEAQGQAVLEAWAGKDAALRRFTTIGAPTLVADGANDRLVPPRNARRLAAGITGSKLLVYKDAGHAFLFQKVDAFAPAVESFLSSGSNARTQ